MKFRAEVEFDDDGPSMAGANCKTIRRTEIITLDCDSMEQFAETLRNKFRKDRYYSTIRRVGNIEEAT